MSLTTEQAKFIAYELTTQGDSAGLGRMATTLMDAQVKLTPHQVDAALFAFQSPLSKGVILADEVGLGKTIEAGLVISQKWAEKKRRILIIVPANLRKQWMQELEEKFFLPSIILEAKTYNHIYKTERKVNPFDTQADIVICSYNFAKQKDVSIEQTPWDLVVIDEAHKLRNVYKTTNKVARVIKEAIKGKPKILLTATPLQNSLLELYGLISMIDEYIFGDLKSFRTQFARLSNSDSFSDLKSRLAPVCHRTLRRQVKEYVNYPTRRAIIQEFSPTPEEMDLYDGVTEYLGREKLYALPPSQRQLMTLVLRRLLASSTFAIADTFKVLINRLNTLLENQPDDDALPTALSYNFDTYEEVEDDWAGEEDEDDEEQDNKTPLILNDIQKNQVKEEIEVLQHFAQLADTIQKNSKGEHLLTALNKGFERLQEIGAPQKALIFTESVRTQSYLIEILENDPAYKGKVMTFNGTNTDARSNAIYQRWLEKHRNSAQISGSRTADKRAALVEHFRNEATIMIATEAGAEGINLQFCSLVVNYDLPWNPQRIEQRIGRCHRFGQKFEVVVVNFLNKSNAADQRVYHLLNEKFQLFEGVFGASDEVLGAISSGVDFEKRIADIYQKCKTEEQTKYAFDQLQKSLDANIRERLTQTQEQLLENFDAEVLAKLQKWDIQSKEYITRYQELLWKLTQYQLRHHAQFDQTQRSFHLTANPYPPENIPAGPYRMTSPIIDEDDRLAHETDSNIYRLQHPLAQRLIHDAQHADTTQTRHLRFLYTGRPQINALLPYIGTQGWLQITRLTIQSQRDAQHFLIYAAFTDSGQALDQEQCKHLLGLPAHVVAQTQHNAGTLDILNDITQREIITLGTQSNERLNSYFEEEITKIDKWAEDMKKSILYDIHNLDVEIKLLRAEARKIIDLSRKIKMHEEIKKLERKLEEKRAELYSSQDQIEARKENFLDDVKRQLDTTSSQHTLFTMRWELQRENS